MGQCERRRKTGRSESGARKSRRISLRTSMLSAAVVLLAGWATLAIALATGASVTMVAAVFCGLLATGSIILGLRAVRDRFVIIERRLRRVQSELDRLRETTKISMKDSRSIVGSAKKSGNDGAGMWPDEISRIEAMIDEIGPLETDLVIGQRSIVERLPRRVQRRMARDLRRVGYLERADVYSRAAAVLGELRDIHNLLVRQSEIDVLSGTTTPTIDSSSLVEPVDGRVLHVVGRAIPSTQSGYTLRTHHTARAQAEHGLDPHVFVQLGISSEKEPTIYTVDGVTYHKPEGRLLFDVGHASWLQDNTDALLEVACAVRPIVLHAHSDFINAAIATAVGRATGIPVIYECRGFWEESWLSRTAKQHDWDDLDALFLRHGVPDVYRWRVEREAEARAAADHVVTLAQVMADRITGFGLPAERLSIVPNAVDATQFTPGATDQRLRSALGIDSDATVVGCITSLVEYEGIDSLVEAFSIVAGRSSRPLALLVVGDGPMLPVLQELVARSGLTNVVLTGKVPHDEVSSYYRAIDIITIPRRPVEVCQLVTPLKPFEAFAAGKPVVMSDVAALKEIATDSGVVELFPAGDVRAFADVLQRLVDDPPRRLALGGAAATWVRAHRSWSSNAKNYAQIYQGVADARRPVTLTHP